MAKQLRIGIVGCGRVLKAHLNGYKELLDRGIRDFTITDLCSLCAEDVRPVCCTRRAAPHPPVSADAADSLNAPHVYVSDLFPTSRARVWTDAERKVIDTGRHRRGGHHGLGAGAHHPVALAGAAHGKHVMVQKPMAGSVAAARQMVDACQRGPARCLQ